MNEQESPELLVDWHGTYDYPDREKVFQLLLQALPAEERVNFGSLEDFLNQPELVRDELLDKLPDPPEKNPADIDIYFYQSTNIGKSSCMQGCEMCFLRAVDEYRVPIATALKISKDLSQQGYNIGPIPPDSFAPEILGLGSEAAGSAYRITDEKKSLGLTAWTSGTPIATASEAKYPSLLEQAYDAGFRAIVMNGQGVSSIPVPFKGVAPAKVIDKARERIQGWNQANPEREFAIGLTFTIRSNNYDIDSLRTMVTYCLENGIDTLRFNCFSNFAAVDGLNQYELNRTQVREFYGNLSQILSELPPTNMSISFSEDFGNEGVDQVKPFMAQKYQGQEIGICRAGRGLFALTQINGELVITGCVDRFVPIMGKVVQSAEGQWKIDWDKRALKAMYYFRDLRGENGNSLLYGCFGSRTGNPEFNDPRIETIIGLKQ